MSEKLCGIFVPVSTIKEALTVLASQGRVILEGDSPPTLKIAHKSKPPPAGTDRAGALLDWMNAQSFGRKFRKTPGNLRLIASRLREPDVQETRVQAMLAHKWKEWAGTDMEKYFRIETLFRASKFDSYYSQATPQERVQAAVRADGTYAGLDDSAALRERRSH